MKITEQGKHGEQVGTAQKKPIERYRLQEEEKQQQKYKDLRPPKKKNRW